MVAALVVATLLLAACGGASHPKTKRPPAPLPTGYVPSVARPNMLVIETDDMRWDELKFMPNVRRLIMHRGLNFMNSFAPYPLCCPSRASFLTGKYAHNHHVYSHVNPFGFLSFDDHLTVATELQKSGYQTALVGKYLNGYARQHIYNSRKSSLHYEPPGWNQWIAGSDHIFPAGSRLHGGTYNYFSMTQNINGRVVPHHGIYSSKLTAQQVQHTIGTFSAAKKPWFVWWTPVAPHFGGPHESDDPAPIRRTDGVLTKFATPARPGRFWGMFDKDITHALGDPPFGPAEQDVSDKPHYLQIPEMSPEEKVALTEVSRQRAESLFALDKSIGATLRKLHATGQYNRTLIAFTSDNGYFLGEHRKRVGKILPHEPSLRVPFLIAGPGVPHGRRYDPITTIDLAPTWMAYAGNKQMPQADGVSMVQVIEKGDRGWDTPVVTEGRMGDRGYAHVYSSGFRTALNTKGIRTARYKYVRYSTGEEELYDLKKDPLELQSRQDDPAYAGIKRALKALWWEYYNCKEAACDKPLPKRFRASVTQTKRITDAEFARTRAYYADYPIRDASR